jgi:hypothetical protein
LRATNAKPARKDLRPVADRQDRSPLRVALRVYGEDGALYDRGTAVLEGLLRSGAVLGGLGLGRQVLPLRPHLIGIRFRSGRLGPVEVLARALEFVYRGDGIMLEIEFYESQHATLALLRRTFRQGRKAPGPSKLPRVHDRGAALPVRGRGPVQGSPSQEFSEVRD